MRILTILSIKIYKDHGMVGESYFIIFSVYFLLKQSTIINDFNLPYLLIRSQNLYKPNLFQPYFTCRMHGHQCIWKSTCFRTTSTSRRLFIVVKLVRSISQESFNNIYSSCNVQQLIPYPNDENGKFIIVCKNRHPKHRKAHVLSNANQ